MADEAETTEEVVPPQLVRIELLDNLFANMEEKVKYIHELWKGKHANGTVDTAREATRWELVNKLAEDLMKLYEELQR